MTQLRRLDNYCHVYKSDAAEEVGRVEVGASRGITETVITWIGRAMLYAPLHNVLDGAFVGSHIGGVQVVPTDPEQFW